MADGPCGEQFKAAFSCFVYSEAEPKGMDCVEKFKGMQDCFREHPEIYGEGTSTFSSFLILLYHLSAQIDSRPIFPIRVGFRSWYPEIDDEEESKEEHSSFTHDHPVPKTPTDTPPENNKAVGVVPREFPTKGESSLLVECDGNELINRRDQDQAFLPLDYTMIDNRSCLVG
jgi:intermembrane space import and assembly protein 40